MGADPDSCRNCGSRTIRLELRDVNGDGEALFEYRRCRNCRLTWAAHRELDLSAYYDSTYFKIPESLEDLRANSTGEAFKAEILDAVAQGRGRLLEIGPAFGAFAVLALDRGFTVDVVEPDAACARFLESLGGISVVQSADPLAFMKSGRQWDVVAMWQSLEHLDDAPEVLEALYNALVPGGVAIIATPDPASLQAKLLRRAWAHNDAPRHRWLFPRRALADMAKRAGLEVVDIANRDRGSVGWNTFGWVHSVGHLVPQGPARLVATWVGRGIALLMAPLERTGGRGASYTAVLTRPR